MEETKQVKTSEKKQTYEELAALNSQLINQCQIMQKKLAQENVNMMFARLDYLFKILEHEKSFEKEFLIKVAHEIASIMDISNGTPKENTEDENK